MEYKEIKIGDEMFRLSCDEYMGVYYSLFDRYKNIAGTISLKKTNFDYYYFDIFVHNTARARGIGTFLMSLIIDWAKKNNINKIRGFISETDKKDNWNTSIPFYLNLHLRLPITKTLLYRKILDGSFEEVFSLEEMNLSNSGYIEYILS